MDRIDAITTVVNIGIVAGLTIKAIVTATAAQSIVPGTPFQNIIPCTTHQIIRSSIAIKNIVAKTAIQHAPLGKSLDNIIVSSPHRRHDIGHFQSFTGFGQLDCFDTVFCQIPVINSDQIRKILKQNVRIGRIGNADFQGITRWIDPKQQIFFGNSRSQAQGIKAGITDVAIIIKNQIMTVTTVKHIDVVTRPAPEGIFTGFTSQGVIACLTIQTVITGTTIDGIIACISADQIVTTTSIDRIILPG